MRNRARNCVMLIPTIHPVGISDRISFVLVGAAVSSFGGSFVVWCWFFWSLFVRGGGFVVFCLFVCFSLNLIYGTN